MTINFLHEAQELKAKLSKIRREFHQIPEIGNHEFKTAELIERNLDALNIPHKRILGTAIIARLTGKLPGRNSALRSDIDALPVTEATGSEFASLNVGMMHACGHDVHITSALGAAEILSAHKEELCGSVTFLFQPDEEGNGGAQRMIDAGAIDDVEAIFGCHVDPALPAGHVGIKYGNFYAASSTFNIAIIGKSAHGAQRDKGIDSIEVTAHIIPEILKIKGGVVSIGMLNAGTTYNVLAGRAEFCGIVRTYGVEERSRMCRELVRICEEISAKFGARAECIITDSCPGIINDNDALTLLVENSARQTLGNDKVHIIEKPLFISEDFGCFLMAKTGCFYHIGAGCAYPLHNDKFLPDPDAIVTASALHSAVVMQYNSSHSRQEQ